MLKTEDEGLSEAIDNTNTTHETGEGGDIFIPPSLGPDPL